MFLHAYSDAEPRRICVRLGLLCVPDTRSRLVTTGACLKPPMYVIEAPLLGVSQG